MRKPAYPELLNALTENYKTKIKAVLLPMMPAEAEQRAFLDAPRVVRLNAPVNGQAPRWYRLGTAAATLHRALYFLNHATPDYSIPAGDYTLRASAIRGGKQVILRRTPAGWECRTFTKRHGWDAYTYDRLHRPGLERISWSAAVNHFATVCAGHFGSTAYRVSWPRP